MCKWRYIYVRDFGTIILRTSGLCGIFFKFIYLKWRVINIQHNKVKTLSI